MNSMKVCFVIAGMLCIAATTDVFSATLKASDESGIYALKDATRWEGVSDIFPDPLEDYYVGGKMTIRTSPQEDMTFAGGSLTLGDSAKNSFATFALRTGNDYGDRIVQFTGERGLVLGRGALDNWSSCCTVISGKVFVASTRERPFVAYAAVVPSSTCSSRKVNCQLEGTLKSGTDAQLSFYSTLAANPPVRVYYRILSDVSEYLGLISVAQQPSKGNYTSRKRVTLELGNLDFAGTMRMENRTTLEAYELGSTVKIKNLELVRGSALSLRWDASAQKSSGFAVSGSLSIEAPVEVRPSLFNTAYDDNGFSVPLLKAPQGTRLNADDFVFIASNEKDIDEFLTPVVTFEVVSDEDGRDVLWARSRPIKRSTADDASGETGSLCYDPNAPRSNWPNGEVAQPEFDYVSKHTIRSLGSSSVTSVFPGNSLTFQSPAGSPKVLAMRCPNIVIPDLRIDLSKEDFAFDNYGGGDTKTNSAFAGYGTMAVKGKMRIRSDENGSKCLHVYPNNKGLVRIDSDISGNGNIDVKMTGKSTDVDKRCYLELAGDNSNWSGICYLTKTPADNASYSCVLFREAKNMGGPFDSFNWKALHLGKTGRLRPLQSVTLDEPTRGIYVAGAYCRFEVEEGIEFTLRQRISYEGTLTKTGNGTFALGGGRPLFAGSETLPPAEGKNRLHIAEGSFMPLSSDAFEGVAVSFAEKTRITLGVPENFEDGVGRWGMALTNAYSSISLPEGGIPVALADGTQPPSREFAIPVCTVGFDAAAALRGKFLVANRRPFPRYLSEIVEKDNGDGTVTFSLSTYRTGFAIAIR